MYMTLGLVLLVVSILSIGCTPDPQIHPIPTQLYSLPSRHTLVISIDGVTLEIIGHTDPNLTISGSSADPTMEILLITLEDEQTTQLQLTTLDKADFPGTVITIKIPNGSRIEIIQGVGSVNIHDFEGQVDIETISAPVRIHKVHGHVHAVSRRGMIQVSDSDGEIDALAEADEIRLTGLGGQITGTNIMGAITFEGVITEGDSVRLETDHGAVNVDLEPGSDAQINITSVGGRIVCTLPGMSGLFGSCEGTFGNGAGHLMIRTVSGAIRIDQTR
jgi:hypothetical protein